MEWKTEILKSGMHRERLIFAWIPRDCEDGITRWLCKVRVLEQYSCTIWYHQFWDVVKFYPAEFEVKKQPK